MPYLQNTVLVEGRSPTPTLTSALSRLFRERITQERVLNMTSPRWSRWDRELLSSFLLTHRIMPGPKTAKSQYRRPALGRLGPTFGQRQR